MTTISIVTVVYNSINNIEKTINSVINHFTNFEIQYIVIDGKSTDGTLEVINKYANKIDVIISEKDEGIYDAMNKSIVQSKGDYIYFLNSGDSLLPGVFDSLSEAITKKFDIIYGDVQVGDKKEIWKCKNINTFYLDMPFSHQAVLLKTSLMSDYKFNTCYNIAADYELFLKFYLNNNTFFRSNVVFCQYDTTGISNSSSFKTIIEYFSILIKNAKGLNKVTWSIKYLFNKRKFLFYIFLEKFNLLIFGRKFKRFFE